MTRQLTHKQIHDRLYRGIRHVSQELDNLQQLVDDTRKALDQLLDLSAELGEACSVCGDLHMDLGPARRCKLCAAAARDTLVMVR